MATQPHIFPNQANAQKSTGPGTPEGKAKPSRNALKLGLFIGDHVLIQEEAQEYAETLASYISDYGPRDNVEHQLVRNLTIATMRQNRLARIEMGVFYDTDYGDTRLDATLTMTRNYIDNQATHTALARAQAAAERSFYRAYNALEQRLKRTRFGRDPRPEEVEIAILPPETNKRPGPPKPTPPAAKQNEPKALTTSKKQPSASASSRPGRRYRRRGLPADNDQPKTDG